MCAEGMIWAGVKCVCSQSKENISTKIANELTIACAEKKRLSWKYHHVCNLSLCTAAVSGYALIVHTYRPSFVYRISLSRFAVCVYVICVNEKPERTQDFFFYTFASSSSFSSRACSSCFSSSIQMENRVQRKRKRKKTTGYSKRSALFSRLGQKCEGKKMCISCPLPEILIARRPVAFPFNSPKPKARKAKKRATKKNI